VTKTNIASRPLHIEIGRTLKALEFQLTIDANGRRHICEPKLSEDVAPTPLPGCYLDIALEDDNERRGANKALVNILRHMSQVDTEAMFSAFAECEATDTFDFRKLISA
jgi:hypothetical protein